MVLDRLSIEVTNRCAKACWFCYNHSQPDGATQWTPVELVSFIRDCAGHGVRAVSFGGGRRLLALCRADRLDGLVALTRAARHFHAYATAYVIRKGRRYTVALTYVRKGQPLQEVIQELLRQAAKAGVRPRYLLLDRGFCSVVVLRYLQRARYPFLMPLPLRGRKSASVRSSPRPIET
jgi:hypothetical protein